MSRGLIHFYGMLPTKQPSTSSSAVDNTRQQNSIIESTRQEASPSDPFQFNIKSQKLTEIIKDYPLPRVIICDKKTCPKETKLKPQVDVSKPLLAFSTRSVRKVHSLGLRFDNGTNRFVADTNNILIPEDYPGWFAVLGSPGQVNEYHPVQHYTKLSSLGTSRFSHFLIAGNSPLLVLMTQKGLQQETDMLPYHVPPGTVLRKAGLYSEEKTKMQENKKKKKGQDVPPRMFLKCYDEQERMMYVNIAHSGVFYPIWRNGVAKLVQGTPILQMKEILDRFNLPLIVRLIFGKTPALSSGIPQDCLLTDSGMCHTLVASTLLSNEISNLEIPLETDMMFHVAQNTPGLMGSKAYVNALHMCKKNTPGYVKEIKVVYGDPHLVLDEVRSADLNQPSGHKKKAAGKKPVPECAQLTLDKSATPVKPSSGTLNKLSNHIITHQDGTKLTDHPVPSTSSELEHYSNLRSSNLAGKTKSSTMIRCATFEPPRPCMLPIHNLSPHVETTKIRPTQKGLLHRGIKEMPGCANCTTQKEPVSVHSLSSSNQNFPNVMPEGEYSQLSSSVNSHDGHQYIIVPSKPEQPVIQPRLAVNDGMFPKYIPMQPSARPSETHPKPKYPSGALPKKVIDPKPHLKGAKLPETLPKQYIQETLPKSICPSETIPKTCTSEALPKLVSSPITYGHSSPNFPPLPPLPDKPQLSDRKPGQPVNSSTGNGHSSASKEGHSISSHEDHLYTNVNILKLQRVVEELSEHMYPDLQHRHGQLSMNHNIVGVHGGECGFGHIANNEKSNYFMINSESGYCSPDKDNITLDSVWGKMSGEDSHDYLSLLSESGYSSPNDNKKMYENIFEEQIHK